MKYYACCTKYRNIKPCQTQKSVCLWMAFNLDYVIWDLAVCIVTLLLYILYGITGHVFIPCTRVICHQHYLVIFMVMMFNATIFQLYHGGQWYLRRKPPTCRKPLTNFITSCCIEHTSPKAGFEFTSLVAICTYCTGSFKSNYHTITTTTVPAIICFAIGWYKKVRET